MASTPTLLQTAKITPQNFVAGTDTAGTYKTIFTAGASGSKIVAIMASSTDTALAHLVTVALTRSATQYIIGSVTVPANAGTNGTVPSVDVMNGVVTWGAAPLNLGYPIDNDGEYYFFLESGDTLQATFATALTAATRLNVIAVGGNF